MLGSVTLKFDDEQLMNRINNADGRARQFIEATMSFHARSTQAYARRNARWTDRTANARGGLIAVSESHGKLWKITLAHSVSYGIWLEIRWGGRYGIIRETINQEAPKVMSTLSNGFLRNVFGG